VWRRQCGCTFIFASRDRGGRRVYAAQFSERAAFAELREYARTRAQPAMPRPRDFHGVRHHILKSGVIFATLRRHFACLADGASGNIGMRSASGVPAPDALMLQRDAMPGVQATARQQAACKAARMRHGKEARRCCVALPRAGRRAAFGSAGVHRDVICRLPAPTGCAAAMRLYISALMLPRLQYYAV